MSYKPLATFFFGGEKIRKLNSTKNEKVQKMDGKNGTYIIVGLVLWRLKCIEQARAAFESIKYALVVKWV